MKNTKPLVILVLLFVVVFLLIISLYINKTKKQFETFTTDIEDYSSSGGKLLDMFDQLEEAEKKCDMIESQQRQRAEKDEMRKNDRIYKELQEQDKKIHELKEIVKYLTLEKKRRDKINKTCKSTKQRKLNENYNIVKSLNDSGMLRDNSVSLDLNVSNSEDLKKLFQGLKPSKNPSNIAPVTKNNASDFNKCPKNDDYINLDNIDIGKCYGCDKNKLKEQEKYIHKDF